MVTDEFGRTPDARAAWTALVAVRLYGELGVPLRRTLGDPGFWHDIYTLHGRKDAFDAYDAIKEAWA